MQFSKAPNRRGTAGPIWFVAMIVTVSTLGWIHRFQQQTEPDLIWSLADLDNTVVNVDDEFEPEGQQPQRSMLRETAKEEAFAIVDTAQLQKQAEVAKAETERVRLEVEKLRAEIEQARTEGQSTTAATTTAIQYVKERAKATVEEAKAIQPTYTPKEEKAVPKGEKAVQPITERKVYWLPPSQVSQKDAFSASWLQKKEDFLTMDLEGIGICEDAAFRAYKGAKRRKLRMSLDWLDFSLEHLSKWWKMLQIFRQIEVYNTAIVRLDTYLNKASTFPVDKSLIDTIAVIAYQPYKDSKEPEQAYTLTVKSLGATIESVRRAGFGRVVVVGDGEKDPELTQDTFRQLKRLVEPNIVVKDDTYVSKVGHMEVAYAQFDMNDAVTKVLKKNVPRATLLGLKKAFDAATIDKEKRSPEDQDHIQRWLGEKESWSYVYLTEPDSILQTRPSTLKQLKEEVDNGMVLVPHRLQPIPHESDARGSTREHLYLAEDTFRVEELDAFDGNDSCCDAYRGPNYKPGAPPMFESCGTFWYMCDFSRKKTKAQRTHDRMKKYSLIRLKQGTGIVSLSSLEHGRPCFPKKNDVCLPPELQK